MQAKGLHNLLVQMWCKILNQAFGKQILGKLQTAHGGCGEIVFSINIIIKVKVISQCVDHWRSIQDVLHLYNINVCVVVCLHVALWWTADVFRVKPCLSSKQSWTDSSRWAWMGISGYRWWMDEWFHVWMKTWGGSAEGYLKYQYRFWVL